MKNIEQHASDDVSIALVGNKCDLNDKVVPRELAQKFIDEITDEKGDSRIMSFTEASAKSAENVEEVNSDEPMGPPNTRRY